MSSFSGSNHSGNFKSSARSNKYSPWYFAPDQPKT